MKANASQMAKLQSSLQAARFALSLDGGKTYNPTGDGDDADEKAKELFDESIWLGAKAMYMVCVYTALTLHRSATTWANNKRGKTQKSSLKVVFLTLNTGETHKVDEYFQHEIVNEMRRASTAAAHCLWPGAAATPGTKSSEGLWPCPGC